MRACHMCVCVLFWREMPLLIWPPQPLGLTILNSWMEFARVVVARVYSSVFNISIFFFFFDREEKNSSFWWPKSGLITQRSLGPFNACCCIWIHQCNVYIINLDKYIYFFQFDASVLFSRFLSMHVIDNAEFVGMPFVLSVCERTLLRRAVEYCEA